MLLRCGEYLLRVWQHLQLMRRYTRLRSHGYRVRYRRHLLIITGGKPGRPRQQLNRKSRSQRSKTPTGDVRKSQHSHGTSPNNPHFFGFIL